MNTLTQTFLRAIALLPFVVVFCAASQAQTLRLKNDPTNASADPSNMPKQVLVNGVGLKLVEPTESGDEPVDFTVVKFVVSTFGSGSLLSSAAEGANFTDTQVAIFRKLKPGEQVYIESIKVRGPDNTVRELPRVIFEIK